MSEGQKDPTLGGRPQSTIAQNFSATLDNAFAMDDTPRSDLQPDLTGLSQSVEQKKKAVTTQNEELEALQARLRQTEQRLQQTSNSSDATNDRGSSTSTQQNDELGTTADHPGKKPIGSTREGYGVDQGVDSSTSTQQDDALGTTAGHPGRKPVGSSREGFGVDQAVDDSVSSQDTRPPVAKGISYSIAHMPGAMPQTPGEDDFQAAWNSATPERPEQR